jgi:hypothetical protein
MTLVAFLSRRTHSYGVSWLEESVDTLETMAKGLLRMSKLKLDNGIIYRVPFSKEYYRSLNNVAFLQFTWKFTFVVASSLPLAGSINMDPRAHIIHTIKDPKLRQPYRISLSVRPPLPISQFYLNSLIRHQPNIVSPRPSARVKLIVSRTFCTNIPLASTSRGPIPMSHPNSYIH